MRLWHQDLLPFLPRAQLLGQHRECCALRGLAWGKKHSVVDYVFRHNANQLAEYHKLVLQEMERRGYKPDVLWYRPEYRGKNTLPWPVKLPDNLQTTRSGPIYHEHDHIYYQECLANLAQKGIRLDPCQGIPGRAEGIYGRSSW